MAERTLSLPVGGDALLLPSINELQPCEWGRRCTEPLRTASLQDALHAKESAEAWWQDRHADAEARATRWLQKCTTLEAARQETSEQEVNRLAQMAALEASVDARGRTVEQLMEQLRYWEKQSSQSATSSEAAQPQLDAARQQVKSGES